MSNKIVIGVDLSLTCTGIAGIHAPDRSWHTTQIKTDKKSYPVGYPGSAVRLNYIEMRMAEIAVDFTGGPAPDLFVLEGPSYASTHGSAHERGGLWWRVYAWMFKNSPTLVIPPTSRAKYATGKGNAGKDEVLAAVIKRYPEADIVDNNTADAVVLAAMGARYMQTPIESSLPKANLSAMDKISLD